MSDPMTNFALSDALRVRRICYPPQLDPLADDIIPTEKEEYLGLLEHLHCTYFHLSLFCIYRAQASGGFPDLQRGTFHGDKQIMTEKCACIGGVWVHLEPAFRPVRGNHLHIQIGGNISSHDILVLNFFGGPGWIFVLSFTLDDFSRRISMDV